MALAKVIDNVTAAVLEPAATVFTPAGPFVIDAVGLRVDEYVIIYKLFSDGLYHPATDYNGVLALSNNPNNIIIEAGGSYKAVKPKVTLGVTVGWELV